MVGRAGGEIAPCRPETAAEDILHIDPLVPDAHPQQDAPVTAVVIVDVPAIAMLAESNTSVETDISGRDGLVDVVVFFFYIVLVLFLELRSTQCLLSQELRW